MELFIFLALNIASIIKSSDNSLLEFIAAFLVVVNVLLIFFVKESNPRGNTSFQARSKAPAALPYDVNDFCAYHSHIVLQPFEDGGARFVFNCKLPGVEDPIDMIMLAKSGVYVFIHVKANGWISGMESNEKWTVKLQTGYGRKPHEDKFTNPVKIVENETKAVRSFLNRDDVLVRSVVVFPDFCFLNNIKVFNPNVRVVLLNQLLPTLVTLNNKTGTNITQKEINSIYENLIRYEVVPVEEESN